MKEKSNNARLMNAQGKRKRKQILLAAGRVFASRGYEGAGMREIAAASNTPPSALIYHFGSKENLFVETLRFHIIENTRLEHLYEPFKHADPSDPQSISNAMLQTVSGFLRVCHGPTGRVSNLKGLITCMLTDSGMGVNRMFQLYGNEIMQHIYELLSKANPALTPTDLFWWSHNFWAQVFYPIVGRLLLLAETGQRRFTEEFLDSLAYRAALNCCLPLGLPAPEGKDDWMLEDTAPYLNWKKIT